MNGNLLKFDIFEVVELFKIPLNWNVKKIQILSLKNENGRWTSWWVAASDRHRRSGRRSAKYWPLLTPNSNKLHSFAPRCGHFFFFFLNSHVTITKGKNGEWTWNDKNNRKNETNKNWAEINCFFVCSVMIVCFKLLNGRLSLIEWKFCRSTGKTGAIEWMWKREPIGACRSTGGWRPPDDTPVSPSTFCWRHGKKMKINFWIILN